jgi:hypothetical protein
MQQTIILIGLFVCHFLADYTHLSTSWMLNAKRLGKPLFPIFMHALNHASLMSIFLIAYYRFDILGMIDNHSFSVITFQLITHFFIDVGKGRMNGWFPTLQNPANKWHWVMFGFDQLLHAIVVIVMAHYLTN